MKADEYKRGKRDGLRLAVAYLEKHAHGYNDPKAREIACSLASDIGDLYLRGFDVSPDDGSEDAT